jgi:hypothetical protein
LPINSPIWPVNPHSNRHETLYTLHRWPRHPPTTAPDIGDIGHMPMSLMSREIGDIGADVERKRQKFQSHVGRCRKAPL